MFLGTGQNAKFRSGPEPSPSREAHLQKSLRYCWNSAETFVVFATTLLANSLAMMCTKNTWDYRHENYWTSSLCSSHSEPDGDDNGIVLYQRLNPNVLWIKGRGTHIPRWSLTPRPFPFTSQLLSPSEYVLGQDGWPFPSGINQSTPDNFLKHLTPFPALSPFSPSPCFASLFKTAGHSSLMLEGQTQLDSKTLHKNTFDLQKSLHLS